MIPKRIHYCWFGRNPKPELAEKCIKSWRKFCPDYEIIEWNEDNYDLSSAPLYVRQAYEAKKWAFVTDYVRLHVVYEHGGIYLDTDVELVKRLEPLLCHQAYFGFEDGMHINTGLGFGATKGNTLVMEIMKDYENLSFGVSGEPIVACPKLNTKVFFRHGLIKENRKQILEGDILILPTEYLCPKSMIDGIVRKTRNTYSIHHYDSSWYTQEQQQKKRKSWKQLQKMIRWHAIIKTPNRIAIKILGKTRYEKIKAVIKKQMDGSCKSV